MNAPGHPEIRKHVADMVLRAQGYDPEVTRSAAESGIGFGLTAVDLANRVAEAMTPHLLAFREIVAAAEENGWDGDPTDAAILNRAREAHAALTGFSN